MLDIIKYPNLILEQETEEVSSFDQQLKSIIYEMFETMYHHKAIGLAANQVGINKKFFVMDYKDNPKVLVNPRILKYSGEKVKNSEGCLSFPNILVEVERSKEIIVEYQDYDDGHFISEMLEGMNAIIAQHEFEHVMGQTFLQYVSRVHRKAIANKMRRENG